MEIKLNTLLSENNIPTWELISYIVVALVMTALAGLFIYLFFKCKKTDDHLRAKYSHKHWGSFKGFWSQNRSKILAFLAAVFFILALGMLYLAIGGHIEDHSKNTNNSLKAIISYYF